MGGSLNVYKSLLTSMLIICLPKLLGMCIIFAVPRQTVLCAKKKTGKGRGGGHNLINMHKKIFCDKTAKRSLP